MDKKLKINFVLPFISLTGGVKIVLEYANRLTERGHYVTVIYPLIPYYFSENSFEIKDHYWRMRGLAANLVRGNHIDWFPLKAKLNRIPWFSDRFLPDGDVVVATAWPTSYSVHRMSKSKGLKFYFIQGYEIWQGHNQEIDNSYRLPFKQLVIASWLKELMQKKFKRETPYQITNGINTEHFYNKNKKFNSHPRLLLMYDKSEWKGFSDGLEAIKIVKKKYPEIKLVIFGTRKGKNIPREAEFYHKPSLEKLRELYNTSDIFISPSWTEGCQLPPMEAMACKCAVVASNVGGIPDYAIAGKTARIFEPRDIQSMAQHIIDLLDKPEELKRMSHAGYEHIINFSWSKATDRLEKVFYAELAGE